MTKASCLKVPRVHGEKTIALVKTLNLFDRKLKIKQVENYLYIPLTSEPTQADIKTLEKNQLQFEKSFYEFPKRAKRRVKLVDVLKDRMPSHLLTNLPHATDFVGDIAIIKVLPELESYQRIIGEGILFVHKRVKTVLAKSSAIEGVYRVRKFAIVAGADQTKTVHKEHGCIFHVDLAKVYFSPRLSFEHSRIAAQVEEGETIVDMFAGVGPFSIQIAKGCAKVRAYAIDANPDAISCLKKNIKANNVEARVTPVLGDARQIIKERFEGAADRVIMNLPEKAIEYIDIACGALQKEGGIIHYYEFAKAPNPLETAKNHFNESMRQTSRNLKKILLVRAVRAIAPYTWQIVVDAEIK
ncbi:MAG: class I SAM-dependent methyltransferase family protein [Candidatus Bathyarchaeota archaeon]|nr:class I SAM-dependent methyltransferase family protein [Candidatus Bathyarchaeota archaeon]